MKVKLFMNKEIIKDSMDIHYKKMTPLIKRIIDISKDETLSKLSGKKDNGETQYFDLEKVYYFESVDKKTFAYLKDDVYEVEDSLMVIEATISTYGFVRINKSNIVNIFQIKSIKPEINMRVRANMENGEYLMINRSYKKNFEIFLKERRTS